MFYFVYKRKKRKIKIRKVDENFLKYKKQAFGLVQEKINKFNTLYNFKFNRVTIRNQSTRWGSCSKKGNLNFNYRIVLLSEPLADYLIVHELCHLGEFNHSKKFWNLVAQTIPDYKEKRTILRKNRLDS